MTNIYIGNLTSEATEDELRDAFGKFGTVASAKIVTDRETGTSRGFGFVDMDDETEANTAIETLDGSDLGGQALTVTLARPKKYPALGGGGGYRRRS